MSDSLKRGNQDCEEISPKRMQTILDELKSGSLANNHVKTRVLQILRVVCTNIFSVPFLKCTNKNFEDKEIETFEDVLVGVEKNEFNTVESVFAKLDEIIEQTIIKFGHMKKKKSGIQFCILLMVIF